MDRETDRQAREGVQTETEPVSEKEMGLRGTERQKDRNEREND